MTNTTISNLASFLSIGFGFGSIIWWGKGIDSRLKAIEDWKDDIEERQNRIEEKIDNLANQTAVRIDTCQNILLNAISNMK